MNKTVEKKLIRIVKRKPDVFIKQVSGKYPLNENLLEKYQNNLNWSEVYNNNNIPKTLIEKYLNKITTTKINKKRTTIISSKKNHEECLSENQSLVWTVEVIEEYLGKINWQIFSKNIVVVKSAAIIDKYYDKWDWNYLSLNEGLPLSFELIEHYENRWNYSYLIKNNSFWENICKPSLNDEILASVLDQLISKSKTENFFTYFSM